MQPSEEQSLLELLRCNFFCWTISDEEQNLSSIAKLARAFPGLRERCGNAEVYRKGVSRLLNNLASDQWPIAVGSAEALGALGEPDAVGPLIAMRARSGAEYGQTYNTIASAVASILQHSAAAIVEPDLRSLAQFSDLTQREVTDWIPWSVPWEDPRPVFEDRRVDCSLIRRGAVEEMRRRGISLDFDPSKPPLGARTFTDEQGRAFYYWRGNRMYL